MKNIYGAYGDAQFSGYIKKLHSMIHWLLVYKDENNSVLSDYFNFLQLRIQGFNSLLGEPSEIVELMTLVECAKTEFLKGPNCDNHVYRRFVLDAHAVIDRLQKKGEPPCQM